MKKFFVLFLCFLTVCLQSPKGFALDPSESITDYQNYNHGYCPSCECEPCRCRSSPCDPCDQCESQQCEPPCEEEAKAENPSGESEDEVVVEVPRDSCVIKCKARSNFSFFTMGVVFVALATAATLIVTSGNGSSPTTSQP